jgi:hypothetical protein
VLNVDAHRGVFWAVMRASRGQGGPIHGSTSVLLIQIRNRLGWHHNTIYRHLKKRGVKMRGPIDWQY